MLKKQHRLTSDFEYKVTRKYGNKYNFNLFNLVVCKPLNYEGPVKVGFVVGTTYHKSAVKRNRVKRLFRQAFLAAIESYLITIGLPFTLRLVVYKMIIMKLLALKLIKLYQQYLSPGNFGLNTCRFNPSCSVYTYQAIDKYGILKGGVMGLWRILRCNPFSKGGNDFVK